VRREGIEVPVFDEQLVLVLLEVETDTSIRESGPEAERVTNDPIEIDELDALERAPDLLPTAAVLGVVEDINQRALEARYLHSKPVPTLLPKPAAMVGELPQRDRHEDWDELRVLERERLSSASTEVGEALGL
jgi:hypothetical protein